MWLLPSEVTRRTRVFGWLSLVGQLVLIATGGAVRLTDSGLGCPTWPRCTADSVVNTPEMGIHGIIEFANRTLTFVLVLFAIVVFLLVIRTLRYRRDLFVLTLLLGLCIPAQAIIGGLSVLTHLNPYVVGTHFVVSIALVAMSAALVIRMYAVPGPRQRVVPLWFAIVAHLASLFVAVTILVGILTTGSGPHAGDANAPRTGLNPGVLEHVHSWPAYATFALTLVLFVAAVRLAVSPLKRYVLALLGIEVVQVCVGLLQAHTGLPPRSSTCTRCSPARWPSWPRWCSISRPRAHSRPIPEPGPVPTYAGRP